jgi:hypothetical protein
MFCVFDVNICDTLIFDEVVQDLYRYMYMSNLCEKTSQKKAETDSPGRIINIRPPIFG